LEAEGEISMQTPELTVAIEAARAAGEILARHFRDGVIMRSKEVANLVSDADIEAENAVVAVIRKHFPDHEILGEEGHSADMNATHLWVVDPLDGTANFAHKIPHFAVSIGYYREGRAEAGVIYNPMIDDWYLTARGQGATHNGRVVRVSDVTRLDESMIGVGFPYDRGALMEATLEGIGDVIRREVHGVRRFGTAALDLCMVGNGLFGAYFEYQLSPWDYAAGRLFVEEAGGKVTTALGDELGLTKTSVLASNIHLHEAMLEAVRLHHP
jgi:myo-inositol-1(or 4)-monophosphatase